MTTTCPPAVRTALSAGLHWLYHTVQPETALVEHRGVRLPAPPRILRFLPVSDAGKPVVVVEVAVHRRQGQFGGPAEVLDDAEILDVAAELASHNVTIIRQDNHRLTATIVLAQPAHESLRAAVGRYAAGCPYHHSLVCDAPISAHGPGCPWRTTGHRAAIWPETPWSETFFTHSGRDGHCAVSPA